MERHDFDAAYARICEVCGGRTQTEVAAFLGIRQSSIADARRRGRIPASWLLALLTRRNVNPAWALTGAGAPYLVPSEVPPLPSASVMVRLAGPELERRLRNVLSTSVTEMLAGEIRALAEGGSCSS